MPKEPQVHSNEIKPPTLRLGDNKHAETGFLSQQLSCFTGVYIKVEPFCITLIKRSISTMEWGFFFFFFVMP